MRTLCVAVSERSSLRMYAPRCATTPGTSCKGIQHYNGEKEITSKRAGANSKHAHRFPHLDKVGNLDFVHNGLGGLRVLLVPGEQLDRNLSKRGRSNTGMMKKGPRNSNRQDRKKRCWEDLRIGGGEFASVDIGADRRLDLHLPLRTRQACAATDRGIAKEGSSE